MSCENVVNRDTEKCLKARVMESDRFNNHVILFSMEPRIWLETIKVHSCFRRRVSQIDQRQVLRTIGKLPDGHSWPFSSVFRKAFRLRMIHPKVRNCTGNASIVQ